MEGGVIVFGQVNRVEKPGGGGRHTSDLFQVWRTTKGEVGHVC